MLDGYELPCGVRGKSEHPSLCKAGRKGESLTVTRYKVRVEGLEFRFPAASKPRESATETILIPLRWDER